MWRVRNQAGELPRLAKRDVCVGKHASIPVSKVAVEAHTHSTFGSVFFIFRNVWRDLKLVQVVV